MVIKDRKPQIIRARVVPNKGSNAYAIRRLSDDLSRLGHAKIVFKSDGEPAIISLNEAVKRESEIDIVLEESPVGEHQANGDIERAIRQVQGQFRFMKDA